MKYKNIREEELKNLPDKTAQLLLKKVYHNIEKNEPIEVTEENNPKMIALKNETKKKLGVEYEYLKRNRFSTKSPSDFYSIISNFLDNYKYKKSYVKSQSSSNLQPDFSNSFDNLEKSIIRESEYNKELEKLMYDHSYEAKDLKNKKKKKAMDFWLRLDKNN